MRRMVLLAKRAPGYRRARRAVLRFGKRNWLVRELAKRILPFRANMTQRVPALTAGRAFDPERAAALPIVLVVAVGFDEPGMDELARRVEQAQRLTGGFVPVFVVDTPAFGPIRTRGYALEHVLGREAWEQFFDPVGWTDYRLERIGTLWRDYGASQVTLVEHDLLPSVQTLMLMASRPAARISSNLGAPEPPVSSAQ